MVSRGCDVRRRVVRSRGGGANHPQDSTNDLSVVVGKSVLLDCANPVERVAVGLGGIAEANAVSPVEILVNGKAPGETSLILWEKGGNREFFNVVVRAGLSSSNDRFDVIRREMNRQLPGQDVKISGENGAVFVSGTVKDLTSSERAVQIASVAGKVVNLLNVEVPAPESQVLLKVVFASVDRNKSKQLGINLFSSGFGNVIGAITTGQFTPPTLHPPDSSGNVGTLSNDLNLFAFFPGLDLGATIEALESKGLVEVLAEPNVLAQDGKQASFLAGGEYPYPVAQGSGTGGRFHRYHPVQGIWHSPELHSHHHAARDHPAAGGSRGQLARLHQRSEISGFTVPAIAVRKVKTEVELDKGQSFAIGGLLDNRETETFQKIPFISYVPILGKFFQSINRTKKIPN